MANEIWGYVILGIFALVLIGLLVSWIITRMKGKIALNLEKYQFSTGEEIKGKIILKLKKPVEAESLKIGLIGVQNTGQGKERRQETFYDFYMPVKGKQIYPVGESGYDFSLKIPANLFTMPGISPEVQKIINMGIGVLNAFGKANASSVKWYVVAILDIHGLNMQKKVQIQIG